jgi:hypothetical protein
MRIVRVYRAVAGVGEYSDGIDTPAARITLSRQRRLPSATHCGLGGGELFYQLLARMYRAYMY